MVVLGVGLNVAQTAEELPVPTATSLAVAGFEVARQDVLVALLARWLEADAAWRAAGGDATAAGLAEAWAALSATVGHEVVVESPGRADARRAGDRRRRGRLVAGPGRRQHHCRAGG